MYLIVVTCFFFQAEDGIRDCLLSRGLGDVYKRQRGGKRSSEAEEQDGPGHRGRNFALPLLCMVCEVYRTSRPAPDLQLPVPGLGAVLHVSEDAVDGAEIVPRCPG